MPDARKNEGQEHVVYASLNRPILILGVPARAFGGAVLTGCAVMWFMTVRDGYVYALAASLVVYLASLWMYRRDPKFVEMLPLWWGLRREYDGE